MTATGRKCGGAIRTRVGSGHGKQLAAPDIDLLRHHIMPAGGIGNAHAARRCLLEICSFFSSGHRRRRFRPAAISIRTMVSSLGG
jgi:hypothetical protein